MERFKLFSERSMDEPIHDVFQYDHIPEKLRIQIIHLLDETFIEDNYVERDITHHFWERTERMIKNEMGILKLNGHNPQESVIDFLLSESDAKAIDAIDIISHIIKQYIDIIEDEKRPPNPEEIGVLERLERYIIEINYRFKQNSVGYEVINGKLIKIDNQLLHQKVIKPAIKLLFEEEFNTASEEFQQAHEHYRKREYSDAIVDAGKAFESTMKIICDRKGYQYTQRDTANTLIKKLISNNLLPSNMQNHFNQLWNTLSCGLPTLRNPNGHGQGVQRIEVPESVVNFAINLAASNIVFLVRLYKESLD